MNRLWEFKPTWRLVACGVAFLLFLPLALIMNLTGTRLLENFTAIDRLFEKSTSGISQLAREFRPGRSSTEFFMRAKDLGAEEFWVESEPRVKSKSMASRGSLGRVLAQASWGSDLLTAKTGQEDFVGRFNKVDARLRSLHMGRALVSVEVAPLVTNSCTVHFKDGKVIKEELSQLDLRPHQNSWEAYFHTGDLERGVFFEP